MSFSRCLKAGSKPTRRYRLGGMYAAELPDPISNSEVKRGRADDSLVHASAKVGSCPFMLKLSPKGEFFRYGEVQKSLIYLLICPDKSSS